ncbi:MAG: energy-coupling factor ABC transporter permease [Candidatus Coatesbacteria bacterium]|nr:energy-coupling factor ABC transporter permease [Candidatus Coatesbacteria bacterium]
MHMADALISPEVGITFTVISTAAIAYSIKKLKDKPVSPAMMGVMGAFVFAAQMINYPIIGTGSSGHIGGGIILAMILGPYAALIAMTAILSVQAFFFADGGLLALGCNIFNMGVIPALFVYPLISKYLKNKYLVIPAIIIALEAGASMVCLQTFLSGRFSIPSTTFILLMLGIHLPIAIIEGIITAGVLALIEKIKPGDLKISEPGTRTIIPLLVLSIITGTVIAWFASTSPDGLEWTLEKIKIEEKSHSGGIAEYLSSFQEKTSFLPDYNFQNAEETNWGQPVFGTSVSGIAGIAIVLVIAGMISYIMGRLQRKQE